MPVAWLASVPNRPQASSKRVARHSHDGKTFSDGVLALRGFIENAASPYKHGGLAQALRSRLRDAQGGDGADGVAAWLQGLVTFANGCMHQQTCKADLDWLERVCRALGKVLARMDRSAEGTALDVTRVYALHFGGRRDHDVAALLLDVLTDGADAWVGDAALQHQHLLQDGRRQLRALEIVSLGRPGGATPATAGRIASALQMLPQLTCLELADLELHGAGASALACGLSHLARLQVRHSRV